MTDIEAVREILKDPKNWINHPFKMGDIMCDDYQLDEDKVANQIVQALASHNEGKPQQIYTLTCEKCGEIFYDKNGFLDPQLCPRCSQPDKLLNGDESLLLSDEEIKKYCKFYSSSNKIFTIKEECWNIKDLLKAQLDHLLNLGYKSSKEVGELVKKEQDRLLNYLERLYQAYPTASPEEIIGLIKAGEVVWGNPRKEINNEQ